MTDNGSISALRFYVLPKTNKPNTPVRPIASYFGTHLYDLSKYIASVIFYGK